MKHIILIGLAGALLSACGVKGDLVREPGTEPPVVATSTIKDASTEPSKPRGTLF
jgi:hypothetical protein